MKPDPNEVWLPIPGFLGYAVSNLGRVKSTTRILRPYVLKRGYQQVKLYVESKRYSFLIHRLVASVFIGVAPEGYEIDHIDGDPANNRADNLRYVTPSENMTAAVARWGTNWRPSGEKHCRAKLSEKQAIEAKRLYLEGMTQRAIAKIFGVDHSTIHLLIKGKNWKHLNR